MRNLILAALAGTLFAASAAPLEIVSPKEGATVPILTADMKTYLAQPRAEREHAMGTDPSCHPSPPIAADTRPSPTRHSFFNLQSSFFNLQSSFFILQSSFFT